MARLSTGAQGAPALEGFDSGRQEICTAGSKGRWARPTEETTTLLPPFMPPIPGSM